MYVSYIVCGNLETGELHEGYIGILEILTCLFQFEDPLRRQHVPSCTYLTCSFAFVKCSSNRVRNVYQVADRVNQSRYARPNVVCTC